MTSSVLDHWFLQLIWQDTRFICTKTEKAQQKRMFCHQNAWLNMQYIDSNAVIPVAPLTHCGRETHICVGKLTIIASNNGLSPSRRQAIIWTNAGILLIRTLGTNFSEILTEIHIFSFKKMHLKMSSAKRWPFCLGLNELMLNDMYTGSANLRASGYDSSVWIKLILSFHYNKSSISYSVPVSVFCNRMICWCATRASLCFVVV